MFKEIVKSKCHSWKQSDNIQISKGLTLVPYSKDSKKKWFICERCGIISLGKEIDDYEPPAYEHYVRAEDNLTCDEAMVRDILT